ncbi:MAG TPA: hypothetical protein VFN74_09500, partial [Chloroflexota bacterium]|nr:hypothetical protein [Chloroflexota bacterium]
MAQAHLVSPQTVLRPSGRAAYRGLDPRGAPGRLARHAFIRSLEGLEGGHLTLRLPDGETRHFGTPPGDVGGGLSARMVVERDDFFGTLALQGPLWIGESYMDGDWHTDDLVGLIELGQRNYD